MNRRTGYVLLSSVFSNIHILSIDNQTSVGHCNKAILEKGPQVSQTPDHLAAAAAVIVVDQVVNYKAVVGLV